MRISLPLAVTLCLAVPVAASAAVKAGSYRGASSGQYQEYGKLEPSTDRGKVSFTVRSGNVVRFRLAGQLIQCGASAHEVPVSAARIRLDRTGRGKATYTNADVGKFVISIKVTSRGTASGTITPKGLCSGTVKFTAKRR